MDAEIITIGDELTSGHRINTNATEISLRLNDLGLRVKFVTSVGDDTEEMAEAFHLALRRAKVVITTGGLGPTDDDMTKKVIVKVFKRNLVFHDEILEGIKERFRQRGIDFPAINQNQALLPQGATFFANQHGSAVGICISDQGKIFISLPGVPREMKQIMDDEVIPYLAKLNLGQAVKVVTLRTTGIVESRMAELIKPDMPADPGVSLAYLPSYSGISLRITSRGPDRDEVDAAAHRLVLFLEKRAARYVFGRNDDSLEEIIGQLLVDNDKTISVAESCTGGQLGMILTSVPGSSQYFVGGLQAYSNDVKMSQLGVSKETIESSGAVSEPCAQQMAVGARALFESDYALSITGIAGPDGGSKEKPVGTTYIGMASAHTTIARLFNFGTDRTVNRIRACYAALEIVRRDILDIE